MLHTLSKKQAAAVAAEIRAKSRARARGSKQAAKAASAGVEGEEEGEEGPAANNEEPLLEDGTDAQQALEELLASEVAPPTQPEDLQTQQGGGKSMVRDVHGTSMLQATCI